MHPDSGHDPLGAMLSISETVASFRVVLLDGGIPLNT